MYVLMTVSTVSPNKDATVFISTPFANNLVAYVCLKSWIEVFGKYRFIITDTAPVPPVGLLNRYNPLVVFLYSSNISISMGGIGIFL